MPLYEYFCPPCGVQFEVLRPMKAMDEPAVCPAGHTTNNRVLSLFSTPRQSSRDEGEPGPAGLGGACACGGACSCGAN